MWQEVGGARGVLLAVLLGAGLYLFLIHDRAVHPPAGAPWPQRAGAQAGASWDASWDEMVARRASSLDLEVTAADLFPSPPAAALALGEAHALPEDEDKLQGWLLDVKTSRAEVAPTDSTLARWEKEAMFFLEIRKAQEGQWLGLEGKLNGLYAWYNGFYNQLLESKRHVNSMHEAPPAPPPPPFPAPGAAAEQLMAEDNEELQALIEPEEPELQEGFRMDDVKALVKRATKLKQRIERQKKSVKFVNSHIQEYNAAHKRFRSSLGIASKTNLPSCEASAEEKREVFVELHTFMDSIFEHMSEGLEAARVEALRIRHSPADGRPAAEETAEVEDLIGQHDSAISRLLARVLPEARGRAAHLAELNSTLAGLQQRAGEIDELMGVTADAAGVLMAVFQSIYQAKNNMARTTALLTDCENKLSNFQSAFKVTLQQEQLAMQIAQLAGGLADVDAAVGATAHSTLDGLALQLQELQGLGQKVQDQAKDFTWLIATEKGLKKSATRLEAFADERCPRLVTEAELTLSAGKAKIVSYYASHRVYTERSDGLPADLRKLDATDSRPPAALPEVEYDFKAAEGSVSHLKWWGASPPPPPPPPGHIRG